MLHTNWQRPGVVCHRLTLSITLLLLVCCNTSSSRRDHPLGASSESFIESRTNQSGCNVAAELTKFPEWKKDAGDLTIPDGSGIGATQFKTSDGMLLQGYRLRCCFASQEPLRHYERQPVQDQMAKVLRPHKKSGYITAMKYEQTIDALNQPDWIMYFTPGPKAYEEFNVAHRTRKSKLNTEGTEAGEGQAKRRPLVMRERRLKYEAPQQPQSVVDLQLVGEFTRRGVTEKKAREILSHLKPGQDALAQLELGDQHITKHPGKYTNPAGFYIHLVEENTPLPEGFETTARRKAREEAERRREDERREQVELEAEYQWYRDEEIDRFMAALDPDELATIQKIKWQEMRQTYTTLSDTMIHGFAQQETKRELGKRAPLLTIEEFKAIRKQGTASSSDSVSVRSTAEAPAPESAPLNEVLPTTATDSLLPNPERGAATAGSHEPAAQPALSESAIELFSKAPEPEQRPDVPQPEAHLPPAQSSVEHTPLT